MIPIQLSKISGFLQVRFTGPSGPLRKEHVLHVPHLAEGGLPRQALRPLEFASPSPRCTYRLAPAPTTLDCAPVRLGSFLASVKSYQVVPAKRRLAWRTSDCAVRSWTWA